MPYVTVSVTAAAFAILLHVAEYQSAPDAASVMHEASAVPEPSDAQDRGTAAADPRPEAAALDTAQQALETLKYRANQQTQSVAAQLYRIGEPFPDALLTDTDTRDPAPAPTEIPDRLTAIQERISALRRAHPEAAR